MKNFFENFKAQVTGDKERQKNEIENEPRASKTTLYKLLSLWRKKRFELELTLFNITTSDGKRKIKVNVEIYERLYRNS